MKMTRAILIACLLLALSAVAAAEAPSIGRPTGFVNDRAGVLSGAERASLEAKLRSYATGESPVEISVLIVDTLGGDSVEDYAQAVFDSWKLGTKGVDNGALLVVAIKDRKLRIHTGYGVEGTLTDATCGQIIRHEITPLFKRGRYGVGITAGVDAMAKVVSGEFDASVRWRNTGVGNGGHLIFFGAVIAMIGGSVAGGLWKTSKLVSVVVFLGALPLLWLIAGACFMWPLAIFMVLSSVKTWGRSTGRTGWFFVGGSGFGGGGGGGFGGFNGGGSGGGGASGSW